MGIIQNGILGKVSGKVAGVVGANWKNKAYLRAWTKPANPNTASQQVQRSLFRDAVAYAKPLVGQIFNTYTDKFQKTMSGFNFFIKRNITQFVEFPDYELMVISEGPLSPLSSIAAGYLDTTVSITFVENYGNNGLATDKVFAACWDNGSKVWFFADAEVDRSTNAISITVKAERVAANLTVYVLAAQYVTGVLKRISNSVSKECVVV